MESPLSHWDVFHGDRLELERGLSAAAILEALARGDLRDDDLVRPAGTTVTWARLAELPELLESGLPVSDQPASPVVPVQTAPLPPNSVPPAESAGDFEIQVPESGATPVLSIEPTLRPQDRFALRPDSDVTFPVINDVPAEAKFLPGGLGTPVVPGSGGWVWAETDDEGDEEEDDNDFDGDLEIVEDLGADDLEILDDDTDVGNDVPVAVVKSPEEENRFSHYDQESRSSRVALPVVNSRGWDDTGADEELPDDDAFSLSRSGPATVEELDLAPMVDVAFQLVLFFMVAAQTVLYKTLEIPKPTQEQAPTAVAQGRSRTLDDLKEDFILVEIDSSGAMKIDRQPISADMNALVERLRSARESTHRKAMLLSADFATPHRNSVLAYDAANEIGLGIVIARPASPQGPAPSLGPVQPAAKSPAPPAAASASSVPN
jgi:biopolymer transport protein ExbD